METLCKYNPPDNPYWCKIIHGYCQFHKPQYVNEHCPFWYSTDKEKSVVDKKNEKSIKND